MKSWEHFLRQKREKFLFEKRLFGYYYLQWKISFHRKQNLFHLRVDEYEFGVMQKSGGANEYT